MTERLVELVKVAENSEAGPRPDSRSPDFQELSKSKVNVDRVCATPRADALCLTDRQGLSMHACTHPRAKTCVTLAPLGTESAVSPPNTTTMDNQPPKTHTAACPDSHDETPAWAEVSVRILAKSVRTALASPCKHGRILPLVLLADDDFSVPWNPFPSVSGNLQELQPQA